MRAFSLIAIAALAAAVLPSVSAQVTAMTSGQTYNITTCTTFSVPYATANQKLTMSIAVGGGALTTSGACIYYPNDGVTAPNSCNGNNNNDAELTCANTATDPSVLPPPSVCYNPTAGFTLYFFYQPVTGSYFQFTPTLTFSAGTGCYPSLATCRNYFGDCQGCLTHSCDFCGDVGNPKCVSQDTAANICTTVYSTLSQCPLPPSSSTGGGSNSNTGGNTGSSHGNSSTGAGSAPSSSTGSDAPRNTAPVSLAFVAMLVIGAAAAVANAGGKW